SPPCDSPCGPAQALFKNVPDVFVRVRAPLFKETSLRAGFLLSGVCASEVTSSLLTSKQTILFSDSLSTTMSLPVDFKLVARD
ncbi:hypothetical protein, partial [Buttiauxella gaviniae]|uniref:hypothetical protein n=1 Tax=Buttiauxella gaviniae TaxID=82990 RepID=UPI003C741177